MRVFGQALAKLSDEELLARLLGGDAAAFETLYERRQSGVYRFALRMSGSTELAEDVVQDVFLELMRDGHQFDAARGTVAGYLFGMAHHRVLRRLQRERSFVVLTAEADNEDDLAEARFITYADPLVELARAEMSEAVRQAILALPAHYREVVVLCNLQELSYEQAAEALGCPIGTVRSRLNRARGMLVEKLRGLKPAHLATAAAALRCEI